MRHFSSSPAASADVINNVSAAMRAFWLSGQRAAHDGRHRKGGPARFKTVPVKAKDTKQTPFRPTRRTPGSYVEFDLQPHPLALAMATSEEQTLGNAGFLADLEAGLQQHAAAYKRVLADLKLLQSIGSLPLSAPDATHVRVHFPGTDWEHVERLCLDLGLQHGVVYEEIEPGRGSYEPLALRFPPVPGDVDGYHEVTHGTLPHRYHSMDSWISAIAPHSLPGSVLSDDTTVTQLCDTGPVPGFPSDLSALESDFEGFEGIYRFLEQLDHAADIRIPHP